jgi:hypothetical protein
MAGVAVKLTRINGCVTDAAFISDNTMVWNARKRTSLRRIGNGSGLRAARFG